MKSVRFLAAVAAIALLLPAAVAAQKTSYDFDLSARTVEAHKYEMMQALDVHSTAELVRYAIEHRLIGD